MSLLQEIQNEAVDSSSDLSALLRKCKLLAARLNSKPLENWLLWESNGYPNDIDVPYYRKWPLELKGHFSGPFGSGIRNAPIPLACLPPKDKELFREYKCRQSIASIEQSVKECKGDTLQVSAGDLHLVLGTKVYENQNCLQTWAEFSKWDLIELLNAVRNKILDFSLAIWKEEPDVDSQDNDMGKVIKPARVEQIINTIVYGGTTNLIGISKDSQIYINIKQNNFETLTSFLKENGIDDKDIVELNEALINDGQPETKNQFGTGVSNWIGKMIKKAANGSWNVGISVAGHLLAEALSKYYGF